MRTASKRRWRLDISSYSLLWGITNTVSTSTFSQRVAPYYGAVVIYIRISGGWRENIEEHKNILTRSFLRQSNLRPYQWKYSYFFYSTFDFNSFSFTPPKTIMVFLVTNPCSLQLPPWPKTMAGPLGLGHMMQHCANCFRQTRSPSEIIACNVAEVSRFLLHATLHATIAKLAATH